jgi:hypothetical protein
MGRLKTAAKVVGYATGVGPAVDLVKGTGESVVESVGHIGGMGKAAFKAAATMPERLPDVPEAMTPEARFWTYMERFGKGPEHIPLLRAQSCKAAYSAIVGVVGFLLLLIYSPMSAGDGAFFNSVRLIVPAALALLAIKHAFANWLFRNEAHGSFLDFARSGDWLPRR